MISSSLRTLLVICMAAALSACGVVEADSGDAIADGAPEAVTVDLGTTDDGEAPDPSDLKLKKSKAKAIARVDVAGDPRGRDGTFDVVGRNVPDGGCIERDVSDVATLQYAPRELFGLAEHPKLGRSEDGDRVLTSVQIVAPLPEGNGILHGLPVSFSARYGNDGDRNDDFITVTNMAGLQPFGEGSATVERKRRRVNVTVVGRDDAGTEFRAAFSCRLPKN